jgi:hypothetical protein
MNNLLGKRVIDIVSGFEGIAIGYAEYLYQTPTILVVSDILKDDKPNQEWFDIKRVKEYFKATKEIRFENCPERDCVESNHECPI